MSLRLLIVGTLLVAACGGGSSEHAIDTSKYSRACTADSDCVPVYQGTLTCCGGGCPNTAIALSDEQAYQDAFATSVPTCNPQPPCVDPAAFCKETSAVCVGGRCTLAMTSTGAISGASP